MPTPPAPLPIAVVDNHTHLDIARDGEAPVDVAEAVVAAAAVGVDRMVQIGCDLPGARFTAEVVEKHPAVLGGVALHPNEAPRLAAAGALDAAYEEVAALAAHPRIRVVGETGLDYFRTGPDGVGVQQDSFRWHIDLAKRLDKALQIHDRDAHDDVLRILAEEGAPERTVLHCFSGDMAMARTCIERGYYLSFAGRSPSRTRPTCGTPWRSPRWSRCWSRRTPPTSRRSRGAGPPTRPTWCRSRCA